VLTSSAASQVKQVNNQMLQLILLNLLYQVRFELKYTLQTQNCLCSPKLSKMDNSYTETNFLDSVKT